jgi:hypothetical protein
MGQKTLTNGFFKDSGSKIDNHHSYGTVNNNSGNVAVFTDSSPKMNTMVQN